MLKINKEFFSKVSIPKKYGSPESTYCAVGWVRYEIEATWYYIIKVVFFIIFDKKFV